MPYLHPERDALEALAKLSDDEPVVMLNLLRYRARAEYPEGSAHAPCSGRDAYRRYGEQAFRHLQAVGGNTLWMGEAQSTLIGPTDDPWDDVLLVQYPSRRAFLQMVANPAYLASTVHRTAALADSRLIAMRSTARRS